MSAADYIPGDSCPECSEPLVFERGSNPTHDDPGDEPMLYCEACDYDAKIAWEAWSEERQTFWRLTEAQRKRLRTLEERIDERFPEPREEDAASWEDVFSHAPDGEFEWKGEAGDWTPCFGSAWAQFADCYDMGRDKNGKRWLERTTVDADGDWEVDWCLSDNDDGTEPKDAWEYLLDLHCHHHLRAVSRYYVYVAETGDDCLNHYYHPNNLNPEKALDSLERYLK